MRWRAHACALVLSVLVTLAADHARAQDAARSFHVGSQIDVDYHGTWYPGSVLEVRPGGQWRIAYDGYGPEWFELVAAARIRPRSPPGAPPPPAPPPGRAVRNVARIGPGTNVLVEWHGTWYASRIVRALDRAHARIHYVGYDHTSDEDVTADRLRLPAKR